MLAAKRFANIPLRLNYRGFSTEYFPSVHECVYAGPDSRDPLTFKQYNPDELILGKKMKDHLRFSMCFWHSFRGTGADPFGAATICRRFDDGTDTLENAKRRIDAAFEAFQKLGLQYYTFHDVDVSPVGHSIEETEENFDQVNMYRSRCFITPAQIADYLRQKQKLTGIELLWGTANLFSHPRYMNGALTSPELPIFARAAAQVMKAMSVTHQLGGKNYVFWGGREGYQSLLNVNMRREIDHAARFYQMAAAYKQDLGASYQLLIEPKPREPMKHQYEYDAATVMGFLYEYGLHQHFKLNIEPNHTTLAGHEYAHDIIFASQYDMLGSIDANTGDPMLG